MLQTIVFTICLTLVFGNELLLQKFYDGNKKFSAETYLRISENSKENFLECPFSAQTILALAQGGAHGETAREIRNAIHLPNSKEKINTIFRHLNALKKNQNVTVHSANRIYVKKGVTIKKKFANFAAKVYDASALNVDFTNKRSTAKTINSWVAEKTENKIQNLVSEESLNDDTVVLLVNALYFQGAWKRPFKKTLTKKLDFYKNEVTTVQVDTMRREDLLYYYESSALDAKFVKLPFKGASAFMVVVLPNRQDGLKDLEARTEEIFKHSNFDQEYVRVTLPKFRIESTVDFKEVLEKLGVNKAFTRADFSAMAGEEGEISISDVIQKAFIAVDESGVEAAASTAVHFHSKSLMQEAGEKKMFVVDHPFLFYIEVDDVIMFAGRVASP